MSDNTTIFVLYVDNDTGEIIRAEQEDASTGERTEVTGNFDAITIKQAEPTDTVGFRVAEPAPDEEGDDPASTTSTTGDAPEV